MSEVRSFFEKGRLADAELPGPQDSLFAQPGNRVHVQNHGVISCDRQSLAFVVPGLIACVKKELVRIREGGIRHEAGVDGAHAEGINTPILSMRRDCHPHASSHKNRQHAAVPDRSADHLVAIFFQKLSRLSSPPNRVVKMVESARRMSPALSPAGGIHRNILNSWFPAATNGWGLETSTG